MNETQVLSPRSLQSKKGHISSPNISLSIRDGFSLAVEVSVVGGSSDWEGICSYTPERYLVKAGWLFSLVCMFLDIVY